MKAKLLLAQVFFAFSIFSQAPTDGLLGSWPFSGNANDAFGTNDGAVDGATLTDDRFGNPNSAYHFDGLNDYILIPSHSDLYRYNTSFTISAWVRKSSYPAGFTQPIFTNRTPTSGSEFYIDGAGNGFPGNLGFASYNGSTYGICRSTGPVAINSGYQHVVVVYTHNGGNNNTAKVYVNGVFNNLVSGLINITLSTDDTYIGWSPYFTQANRHFDGDIDDIFLYNRDLTDEEILALYNDGNVGIDETVINNFELYPNPVNETINFRNVDQNAGFIEIIGMNGQVVGKQGFENHLNVSFLESGMYFVVLLDYDGQQLGKMKFIKN